MSNKENKLAPCPNSPNCICSEYPDDKEHFIAPIDISGLSQEQIKKLAQEVILSMGGQISQQDNARVNAVFTSLIFRFKDDVSLRFDWQQNTLHLRSASRVGYSDFGVNKTRLEEFIGYFKQRKANAKN